MYNFISNEKSIDYKVPDDIKRIMDKCEEYDKANNHGSYVAYASYLVKDICKEAFMQGRITLQQWHDFEDVYKL